MINHCTRHYWIPLISRCLWECNACKNYVSWKDMYKYKIICELVGGMASLTRLNYVLDIVSAIKEKELKEGKKRVDELTSKIKVL